MAVSTYFLVQTIIVHLFQVFHPTDSFGAGFPCSYSEFKTFLNSERSCPYSLTKLRDNCTKDVQLKNVTCMVFLNSDLNGEENVQITSAQIKFYSYGVRYKFDLKSTPCNHTDVVKPVNVTLICEHKTVLGGKLCRNNASDSCDRNNEICQHQGEVKENLCIQIQHLYEPCDDYSPCEKNTECKQSNVKRTCQCLEGYHVINGRCIKGGLFLNDTCDIDEQCTGTNYAHCIKKRRKEQSTCQCIDRYVQINTTCFKGGVLLNESCYDDQQCTGTDNTHCSINIPGQQSTCQCIDGYVRINSTCFKGNRHVYESCDWPEQCTGSIGANQCKYFEGFKMCYCLEGYIVINGACLKAGVSLGQPCYLKEQCDGTLNSTVCKANTNGSGEVTCQCNSGFIEIKNSCLGGDKGLYEECEADSQCSGGSGNMVCGDIQGRKLCFCDAGFVEDRKSFKCRRAGVSLGQPCYLKEQCDGTLNSTVCKANTNGSGEVTCQCNSGFIEIKNSCLGGDKGLYEECEADSQCSGGSGNMVCGDIQGRKLCFCDAGFVEDRKSFKCRRADRKIHDLCKINQQCNGTENANTCHFGDNVRRGECACNRGFEWIDRRCLEVGRFIYEQCDHQDQCTGTKNANNCTDFGNNTLCYCNVGYIEFEGKCIKDNKALGESCEADIQCSGTDFPAVCGYNGTCSCAEGFIRLQMNCLPVGRQIFEPCDHPDQCNGTENAHACSDYGNKSLCYCNHGYLEFKGKCFQGDKKLGESCKEDFQCKGTENRLVCGENLTCSCSKRFIRINETCLQGNLSVGQVCTNDLQCTGTVNTERCLDGKCFCKEGFMLKILQCQQADEPLSWINDKDNQFLLIAGAGCFGTIVFFFTTLLLALKRNKSGKMRFNSSRNEPMRDFQYPMTESSSSINTAKRQLIRSEYAYSDPIEHNYFDFQQEETENESGNVYTSAQHPCSYRTQDSESMLYSYNHLHEEHPEMLEGLYDSSTAVSLSTFTKDK